MNMQKKVMSGLLLGLLLTASSFTPTSAGSQRVWITVGDSAFSKIKEIAPNMVVSQSRTLTTGVHWAPAEEVHLRTN